MIILIHSIEYLLFLLSKSIIFHRIHNPARPKSQPRVNNTLAFTAGYRLDGKYFLDERAVLDQIVLGTKFHSLKLVIDNDSNHSTKLFFDKAYIGAFQEHFAPRSKGGVFIVNEIGGVGLFRNFKIQECEGGFDDNGNCGM